MKIFLSILFVLFVYWLGAVQHESDLARNFKETGDAGAWFWDIKK
jgi:hypothetical protein